MPLTRVVVNGIPFTFDAGDASPEQAAQALSDRIKADPSLMEKRSKQLGLDANDVIALQNAALKERDPNAELKDLNPPETTGMERFMVGAGHTLEHWRSGATQMFTGDETDKQINARLKQEDRLFKRLDDSNVGAEDFGQLAPDVAAFLGGGGLVSLFARGAAIGAVQPTDEANAMDGLKQRGGQGLLFGVLSVLGPGAANKVSSFFNAGTKMAKGGIASVSSMVTKYGNVGKGIAAISDQAQDVIVRNSNKALQELGETALARTADIFQKMNNFGKVNTVKEFANNALKRSIKEQNGANVLDMNAFNRELIGLSDSQLKKSMGKDFGRMIGDLRKTFTKISTVVPGMDEPTAIAIVEGLASNGQAQALAKALIALPAEASPQVVQGLVSKLINASLAGQTLHATEGLQGE